MIFVDFDDSAAFGPSPNWELLGPPGYRFYMPGNVGPAWQNASTTVQLDDLHVSFKYEKPRGKTTVFTSTTTAMDCIAQECPMLLRQGVMELFPAMDVGNSNLTVVSLMQKVRGNEIEELAKHFVLAAQDICSKLKQAGFWADFINPFSGRPYLSPSNSLHYETDARFRCLGFHINEQANCKVISELKGARSFVDKSKVLKLRTSLVTTQSFNQGFFLLSELTRRICEVRYANN
uniref:Methylmalonic aciduria and homocystinuria type D protein n=1 Tax=Timema poppense TaxID=170557 RepID=A0A7R9CVX3_TIMPO|nr:unnamed protein product [Timema poppensis]